MNAPDGASGLLEDAHSIVVKVGSSLLIDSDGELRQSWLNALAEDIASLLARGQRIAVVSSGAVALGAESLSVSRAAMRLEHKQAAAAVGQIVLAQAWQVALGARSVRCAQVLLTPQDTEHRRRHLNARATMETLAKQGIVPIINENDTVATDELRYGDNDRLAARVAQMIGADLLMLLSDVDGVYTADPTRAADAAHIAHIENIDAELMAAAGGSGSTHGTGGMRSKLEAAKIATDAGVTVMIGSGQSPHPLRAIGAGAVASVFSARTTPMSARRRWISASLKKSAQLVVDAGAAKALADGGSLLPIGVSAIVGEFQHGDCVSLRAATVDGVELGVGLVTMNSNKARALSEGARSGERTDPLVHRDNLVLHRDETKR